MVAILKANKAVNAWECVQEANAEACMAAVELGAADVVSVGASAVFKASEKFGVQLIAGEVRLFFIAFFFPAHSRSLYKPLTCRSLLRTTHTTGTHCWL
jgi:hypothetical protein